MLLFWNPPYAGVKCVCGIRMGSVCRPAGGFLGDQHRAFIKGVGAITTAWTQCLMFLIEGTHPGMLFCILRKCVCFINLRAPLVVGLGAAIIGGASVICGIVCVGCMVGVATLCSTLFSTLCSILCFGGGM
jgi:hypothetical protein